MFKQPLVGQTRDTSSKLIALLTFVSATIVGTAMVDARTHSLPDGCSGGFLCRGRTASQPGGDGAADPLVTRTKPPYCYSPSWGEKANRKACEGGFKTPWPKVAPQLGTQR